MKKEIFEKGKSPSPSIPKHSACGKRPDTAVLIRAVRKNIRIRSVYTCLFEALHSARASVPEAQAPFVHGSVSQPTVAFADLCAIKNKGDGGRDHKLPDGTFADVSERFHEPHRQARLRANDTNPKERSERNSNPMLCVNLVMCGLFL